MPQTTAPIAMRTHVDWLTFTLSPVWVSNIPDGGFAEAYVNAISDGFLTFFNNDLALSAFGGTWEKLERARAPYSDAWKIGERGITVFAHPSLTHFCVEISGAGCEYLIGKECMTDVVEAVKERVTRIDIATDIETKIRPDEFVSFVNHERMRASGYQKSETGETSYVGSQKSDRYARVYRYNSPHPRSHLLRVEHVFRRSYAKMVCEQLARYGIESIAKSAGDAFGWGHSDWKPAEVSSADISIVSPNREAGKTIRWLVNACAPAFKKLCENGDIRDAQAFIEQYFLPEK